MSITAIRPGPARAPSLDSDSLSGSLSDSGSASPPLTLDTAATSEDEQLRACDSPLQISPKLSHRHPRPKPRRSATTPNAYLSCSSSSLLRTTLLSFTRTSTSTSSPITSSRRSSLSIPSSTGSPIEALIDSKSLHATSTTEVCTNSNPSLAQFSPTPRASSCLAMLAPHVGFLSTSPYYSTSTSARRYGPRSRSASCSRPQAQAAYSGSRPRLASLRPFSADDVGTSALAPPPAAAASAGPFAFWRKQQQQQTPLQQQLPSFAQPSRDTNSPPRLPPALVLPSISRAHVPDLILPDGPSGTSSPSSAASEGFLKIDGSRDGLSFRTTEDGSSACFVGTPRPSFPISQAAAAAEHEQDEMAADVVVVVQSPVEEADSYGNGWNGRESKGKGKERATIPNAFYPSATATATPALLARSASVPIPFPSSSSSSSSLSPHQHQHQQRPPHQPRIKIVLPPPPIRSSSTTTMGPMLKPRRPTAASAATGTAAIPPTLTSVEKSSRLMRDRVCCATCAAVGVDFPRCPRCAEAWCTRACRVARLEDVGAGRRKHVCKT